MSTEKNELDFVIFDLLKDSIVPMKRKTPKLVIFLALIITSGYAAFNNFRNKGIYNKFYRNKTNSIVIDSGSWQYNAIEYVLKDGMRIQLWISQYDEDKIDIHIGDSIVKKENSLYFDIYKKNNFSGKYEFHHNIQEAKWNYLPAPTNANGK